MWGQPFPVAVAQDGVVEEAEPFFHDPVAGDDEAGGPVPVEDEFVKIGRLLGGEAVEVRVVEDEQVGVRKERKARSTELSTLAWANPQSTEKMSAVSW